MVGLPWKEGIVRLEVEKDTFVSLGREGNTIVGQNENGKSKKDRYKKNKKKEKKENRKTD